MIKKKQLNVQTAFRFSVLNYNLFLVKINLVFKFF